jgi:hypothetical protein
MGRDLQHHSQDDGAQLRTGIREIEEVELPGLECNPETSKHSKVLIVLPVYTLR